MSGKSAPPTVSRPESPVRVLKQEYLTRLSCNSVIAGVPCKEMSYKSVVPSVSCKHVVQERHTKIPCKAAGLDRKSVPQVCHTKCVPQECLTKECPTKSAPQECPTESLLQECPTRVYCRSALRGVSFQAGGGKAWAFTILPVFLIN